MGHNEITRIYRRTNGLDNLVWMTCYIAVDFRARLRFPRGLILFAFPAGVSVLPFNQQLEATTHMKATFILIIKKRTNNQKFNYLFVFYVG